MHLVSIPYRDIAKTYLLTDVIQEWLPTTQSMSIRHGLSIALRRLPWVPACGFLYEPWLISLVIYMADFESLSSVQLMYRAKKDGPALLGLKHPWDH